MRREESDGDWSWCCRHTTSDAFKAFVAADLLKEVSVRSFCVVAAADVIYKAPLMTFYSGEVKGGF